MKYQLGKHSVPEGFKTCPFCDSSPEIVKSSGGDEYDYIFQVGCFNYKCYFQPKIHKGSYDESEQTVKRLIGFLRNRWNTRGET